MTDYNIILVNKTQNIFIFI